MKNEMLIELLKIAILYWSKKLNESDEAERQYKVLLKFEELLKNELFNTEDFKVELINVKEEELNKRLIKYGYTDPLNSFNFIIKRCKIIDFINPGTITISSIDDLASKAVSYKRLWLSLSIATPSDNNLMCSISDLLCPLKKYLTCIRHHYRNAQILDVRPDTLVINTGGIGPASLIESVVVHSLRYNKIDDNYFRGACNMKEISFDANLAILSIGLMAFDYCESLSSINIPEGVRDIEYRAFGNSGISNINLPNSLICIGDNAFNDCKNLKELILPPGLICMFVSALEGSHVLHIIANIDKEIIDKQKSNVEMYYGFGYDDELTTITFTSLNLDEHIISKIDLYKLDNLTTIEVANEEIKAMFEERIKKINNLNPNLKVVLKN